MGRLGDSVRWGSFRWSGFQWGMAIAVAALLAGLTLRAVSSAEPTIEELKARIDSASLGEKPKLCVQVAQRELTEADKLYAAAENEKGQAALTDTVTFSEEARDFAIRSHKNEKQTEIAVRGMIRKLNDMLHTLSHDEQAPLKDAIGKLQRVRDDLLAAMFPKGAK
jgi:hypothetical protein